MIGPVRGRGAPAPFHGGGARRSKLAQRCTRPRPHWWPCHRWLWLYQTTFHAPIYDQVVRHRSVIGRHGAGDGLGSPMAPREKRGAFPVGTATVELAVPAPSGQGTKLEPRTEIWYPAINKAQKLVPDPATKPDPLIVFSQGFDLAVNAYSSLLGQWASAGFMVAAPGYPYTSPPKISTKPTS